MFIVRLLLFSFCLILLFQRSGGQELNKNQSFLNVDSIPEKAYLRYGFYDLSGKLTGYAHHVWVKEKENEKNYLKIYENIFCYSSYAKDKKSHAFLPEKLEGFQTFAIIDLEKSQVIEERGVYSNSREKIGRGQYMYISDRLDISNSFFETEYGMWNGYEMKIFKGRTKVDLSLPVLNYTALSMRFPVGFTDFSGKRKFQFAFPEYFKESVIGSFKIIKEEKINTVLGEFDTIKLGTDVHDFLLRLMAGRWAREFCIYWIDKNTKMVVKINKNNSEYLILDAYEEFTNWSDVAEKLNKEWVEQVCFKKLGVD
ncbi:MAG: hypothetical protein WHS77_01445 [Brevinematales bacterium]